MIKALEGTTEINLPYDKATHMQFYEKFLEHQSPYDYLTLYIHTPVCLQRCAYCMHNSLAVPEARVPHTLDRGISILEMEFAKISHLFSNQKIRAIYFGGGSPSLMTPSQIEQVLTLVDKYWDVQKTSDNMLAFEGHPSQITQEKLTVLKQWGINRFSMGIQTFDEEVAKQNNRIFISPQRILSIYDMLRENFSRVNVDLMFGIKGQTLKKFLKDVNYLIRHDVQRLTMYGYNNCMGTRPEPDEQVYQDSLIQAMGLVEQLLPDSYNFTGAENGEYAEFNCIWKRGFGFKYPYSTAPLAPAYTNNILGFSMNAAHAANWFMPLETHALFSSAQNQMILRPMELLGRDVAAEIRTVRASIDATGIIPSYQDSDF